MKKMISAAALLLSALAVLLVFAGCAAKKSGVSIDDVKQAFLKSDDSFNFVKTESDDGITAEYARDEIYSKATYTVTADKTEDVKMIKIVYSDITMDRISSAEAIYTLLSKTSGGMSRNDLKAAQICIDLMQLDFLFGRDEHEQVTTSDISERLYQYLNGTQIGKWNLDVDRSGKTVTVTAEYGH